MRWASTAFLPRSMSTNRVRGGSIPDLNADGTADLVSLGATDGTVSVWLQR